MQQLDQLDCSPDRPPVQLVGLERPDCSRDGLIKRPVPVDGPSEMKKMKDRPGWRSLKKNEKDRTETGP